MTNVISIEPRLAKRRKPRGEPFKGVEWSPDLSPESIAVYQKELAILIGWIETATEESRPVLEVIQEEKAEHGSSPLTPSPLWSQVSESDESEDWPFRSIDEAGEERLATIFRAPCPSGGFIYALECGSLALVKDGNSEAYWHHATCIPA